MTGPARRSRRTRNKPPEVIPLKAADASEKSDNEDDKAESDQEDSEHDDPLEQSRSSKRSAQKVAASKPARQARTRKGASTSRPSSPAAATRRRRRAPNPIDDNEESNEDIHTKSDDEETEHSLPSKKQRKIASTDMQTRRPRRMKAAKVGMDPKDDEDFSKQDDSDSETGDEVAERQTSNDDSDNDSFSRTGEDNGDDSDNEPISSLMKRKRQTRDTNEGKNDGAMEDAARDNDKTGEDAPNQSLASSSAATSTDEATHDKVNMFEKGSRTTRPRRNLQAQIPPLKSRSARSSGDEGDSDVSPHKRTKRRVVRGNVYGTNAEAISKDEKESTREEIKDDKRESRRGRLLQDLRKQTEEDSESIDDASSDESPDEKPARGRGPQEASLSRNGGRFDAGEKSDNSVGTDKVVRRRGKRERARPTVRAGDTKTTGDDGEDVRSIKSDSLSMHDETFVSTTADSSASNKNQPDESSSAAKADPSRDDEVDDVGRSIQDDLTTKESPSSSSGAAAINIGVGTLSVVPATILTNDVRPIDFDDSVNLADGPDKGNSTHTATVQSASSIKSEDTLFTSPKEAKGEDANEGAHTPDNVGMECDDTAPGVRSVESQQVVTMVSTEPTDPSTIPTRGDDVASTLTMSEERAPYSMGVGEETKIHHSSDKIPNGYATVEPTSANEEKSERASTPKIQDGEGFETSMCSGLDYPDATETTSKGHPMRDRTPVELHHENVNENEKKQVHMDSSQHPASLIPTSLRLAEEELERTVNIGGQSSSTSMNITVLSDSKTRSDLYANPLNKQGESEYFSASQKVAYDAVPSKIDNVRDWKNEGSDKTSDQADIMLSESDKISGTNMVADASKRHVVESTSLCDEGARDGMPRDIPAVARVLNERDDEKVDSVPPDQAVELQEASDDIGPGVQASTDVRTARASHNIASGQDIPVVVAMKSDDKKIDGDSEGSLMPGIGRSHPTARTEHMVSEQPHILESAAVSEVGESDSKITAATKDSAAEIDAPGLLATETGCTPDATTVSDVAVEMDVSLELDDSTKLFTKVPNRSSSRGAVATDGTSAPGREKLENAQDSSVSSLNPVVEGEPSSVVKSTEKEKDDPEPEIGPSKLDVHHGTSQRLADFSEASGKSMAQDGVDGKSDGPVERGQAAMRRRPMSAVPAILSIPLEFEYKVKFGRLASGISPITRAAPTVSTVVVLGESKLRRVKSVLYSVGSKVHRGAGFERIFAEYWDAMALRLSGTVSCHTSERCQQVMNTFLKTAKLRRLHNMFIMSIMRHASTKFAGYDELAAQIPSHWRDRIKVSPADSSGSRETPVAPITRDRVELNNVIHKPPMWKDYHVANSEESKAIALRNVVSSSINLASSNLPGALTVDPLVRKLADKKNMQVSELAVWLMSVAVKEHTLQILRSAITQKESIDEGHLPERRVKFPNGLAGTLKPSSSSEKPEEAEDTNVTEPTSKTLKEITILDLYAASSGMPSGRWESVGGSVSRSAMERSLHVSYDHLCSVPAEDLFYLQQYVTDQILTEAKIRTVPLKPKVDESARITISEGQTSTKSPIPKQPISFTVPPPAPAVGRSHPIAVAQGAPQEEVNTSESAAAAHDAMIRGMGRGAKDLAALMKRSTPVVAETAISDRTGIAATQAHATTGVTPLSATGPTEDSSAAGAERQGKGFGTKNLAALRARATTQE